MEKLFPIGKVTKASGLKGEVHVSPLCRYFEDYSEEPTLFLGFSNESALEMKLKKSAPAGKKRRIQFEGVHSRTEAEALVGQQVFGQEFLIPVIDEIVECVVHEHAKIIIRPVEGLMEV